LPAKRDFWQIEGSDPNARLALNVPPNTIVFEGCHAYEVAVDTYSTGIFEMNLLWAFFHDFLDVRE